MIHKHWKSLKNSFFWSAGCSLLRAKVFSCSLDISELRFLIKKTFFSSVFVIQTLDPDWIRIRIPILTRNAESGSGSTALVCITKKSEMSRFLFRNSESRSAARTMRSSRWPWRMDLSDRSGWPIVQGGVAYSCFSYWWWGGGGGDVTCHVLTVWMIDFDTRFIDWLSDRPICCCLAVVVCCKWLLINCGLNFDCYWLTWIDFDSFFTEVWLTWYCLTGWSLLIGLWLFFLSAIDLLVIVWGT